MIGILTRKDGELVEIKSIVSNCSFGQKVETMSGEVFWTFNAWGDTLVLFLGEDK